VDKMVPIIRHTLLAACQKKDVVERQLVRHPLVLSQCYLPLLQAVQVSNPKGAMKAWERSRRRRGRKSGRGREGQSGRWGRSAASTPGITSWTCIS
jgi:hypothetical protein